MEKYERFEEVIELDDEDLMSSAFSFNEKTGNDSTNCMASCSDSCCC